MTLSRTILAAVSALAFAALVAAAPNSFARGASNSGSGGGGGSRSGADGSGPDDGADGTPLGGTAMGSSSGMGQPGGTEFFCSTGDEQKEILRDVFARYAGETFREFRSARNGRTAGPVSRR